MGGYRSRSYALGRSAGSGRLIGPIVLGLVTACAAPFPPVPSPLGSSTVVVADGNSAGVTGEQGLFVQAMVDYQRGNLGEALRLTDEVIQQIGPMGDQRALRAHLLRAQCRLDLGEEQGAREDLRECARIDPDSALPRLVAGGQFLERHRFEDAVESFTAAARLEPAAANAWNGLGLAWVGLAAEIEPTACRGATRTRARMFERACRAFQRAVDADQGWDEPLFNLAVVHAAQGRREITREIIATLEERFGDAVGWRQRLALALVGLVENGESVWYLQQALRSLEGQEPEVRLLLARCTARLLIRQGRLDLARDYVTLCLELAPGDPEARLWSADIDALAGRVDEAASSYRAVFEGGDLEVAERALVGLASLLGSHGDPELAFEILDAGLHAGLHSPRLLAVLGDLAERTGATEVAQAASATLFDSAGRDPALLEDADFLRSMAARLVRSRLVGIGDLDRACDVLTALVQVTPASPVHAGHIERARRLTRDPDHRRAVLLKLLERLPVTPGGIQMLGRW